MDLEEAKERLSEAGLYACVREGGRLVIARSVVAGDITVLREMTYIQHGQETWHFVCWETAPGPGPDDGDHAMPGLQEAVAVALRWYFGEPVLIGEWRIAAHKHPEWEAGKLERAVLGAKPLPVSEWQRIQKKAHASYVELLSNARTSAYPWEAALPLLFNPIRHPSRRQQPAHLDIPAGDPVTRLRSGRAAARGSGGGSGT
jgi:hypothetical protein